MLSVYNESVNGFSTLHHAYSLSIKKGNPLVSSISFLFFFSQTKIIYMYICIIGFIIVSHHHDISKTGKRLSFFYNEIISHNVEIRYVSSGCVCLLYSLLVKIHQR